MLESTANVEAQRSGIVDRLTDSEPRPGHRRLSVCIINPRSQPSYWTFDFATPFFNLGRGRQYSMANGPLLAVAALVPAEHEVVILDENVEEIDFESLKRFDVIGVTGMIVQANRMIEILTELRNLPATLVVGGPYVTLCEQLFEEISDVRFIGEAEQTWPAFLTAFARGEQVANRYEQEEKTDMTRVPVPRFDLLKPGRYATVPVQFSRGCPFLCEFCDIITIFGRRPRVKRPEQVIAELEALAAQGFANCFLVDDNFIGNKVEAKRLLRQIIEWQQTRPTKIRFTTEASINLANDPELIDLLVRANFASVLIGIETPREASLTETRKHQNVHGDSLLDKVFRIRAAGLEIAGGFIVGFDHDDEKIFDEQFAFIQASGIANLSIGLLQPLPTTPLYDRLLREGRLDFSDPEVNFIPKLMTREQLKLGFHKLVGQVFEAEAYFDRVFTARRTNPRHAIISSNQGGVRANARSFAGAVIRATMLGWAFAKAGELRLHLRAARNVLRRNASLGKSRLSFAELVTFSIWYWHFTCVTEQIGGTDFGTVRHPTRPPQSLTTRTPQLSHGGSA